MNTPQNPLFWQKIAEHPEAVQKSFWYGAEDLAKFLGDSPNLYSTYLKYDSRQSDADWPWWKKILFYYVQSERNKEITQHNMVVSIKDNGSWIYGVLQGDFNKNPTMSQIIVSGIISLIPVADQVCDVRDLISNLVTLSDEKQRTTENYMALALTGIGLVPELGSATKTVVKAVHLKGLTKVYLIKTMEAVETTVNKVGGVCPWGRAPETWLRSQPWKKVASDTYNSVKANLNRLKEVITHFISHTTGLLKQKLTEFMDTINKTLAVIQKYITELCNDVNRRIGELLPQPAMAMAGHSSPSRNTNTPTNRYELNTSGSHPTHVTHQQKEKNSPEKDKTKDKDPRSPCILRPYRPETCKPLGKAKKTGHHIVPDRCFRYGSRRELDKRILGAISENQGLVVCVTGESRNGEHGQLHQYFDKKETIFGKTGKIPGVTELYNLEVAAVASVVKVFSKCSREFLLAQIREYHGTHGMPKEFQVRADPTGKMTIDPKKLGIKSKANNQGEFL